jgi:cysteinyl-tRNA synthetase
MFRMYPLMVFNSLTRTKVRFIPKDPKTITWYQCGPTVYADSHMGHAYTYLSLDIIARIVRDFLGYNVVLCQNVTDVDDKIIIRSSERGIPFRELASKYEKDFTEDMNALGVQLPDITTRVSEYVPEIIAYIETLIAKGVAYESNGSVYFSVADFEMAGHKYGKLMPEQIGNAQLLEEGEGSLTNASEKRGAQDFVLWKRTKDEATTATGVKIVEPSWTSPWGQGRPGWHIECSVMSNFALQKFGAGRVDIHAGGVDLKFPHHENEIAQSEGYSGSHQWVNYWLHTGHLNIKGLKMSKSLKNFITIREALELHTARQIRFCFLLHKYNAPMDYTDSTMTQAVNIERIFAEYFHNVKALLRRLGDLSATVQHVGPAEEALLSRLEDSKTEVRACLMDDFNTPGAVSALTELIRDCNRYMESGTAVPISGGTELAPMPAQGLSSVVLSSVARYVTSILRTFGLAPSGSDIGFGLAGQGEAGAESSKEAVLTPYLDVLTEFRKEVRLAAMRGDTKEVLQIADRLRDDRVPVVGVRLVDKGSGADVVSVWKLDDPETMRKERAQKEAAKAEKEAAKAEMARLAAEREARAAIPPEKMFLPMTDLYSAFDEAGLPTTDKAGEPLSKGVLKKLAKDQAKQKEAHDKYLEKQQQQPADK